MAEQEGAGAGPQVQHDEFMDEDGSNGGSGDEGDPSRAREPKPIEEELEEYSVIAVYATEMEEWKTRAPDTAYAATRQVIIDRDLPSTLTWKDNVSALRAGKAGCNTGLATLFVHDPIDASELPYLHRVRVRSCSAHPLLCGRLLVLR